VVTADPRAQEPRLAAVIGWPIRQSLSPAIHRFWADREGVAAYYAPVAAAPTYDAFARVADGLAAAGFRGANVTAPHKEHALRYASRASGAARRAGAANMLTFTADGAAADNADIDGFADACRAAGVGQPQCALVLGAGGAARGVALALDTLGAREIIVCNRTDARSRALVSDIGIAAAVAADWSARNETARRATLIVNTTSAGMKDAPPLDFSLDGARKDATVVDIVYSPLETPLLAEARAGGLAVIDGLAMLMHQAVYAYRAWLGAGAVVDDALRAHLLDTIAKRRA